jgi:hypothetical protein
VRGARKQGTCAQRWGPPRLLHHPAVLEGARGSVRACWNGGARRQKSCHTFGIADAQGAVAPVGELHNLRLSLQEGPPAGVGREGIGMARGGEGAQPLKWQRQRKTPAPVRLGRWCDALCSSRNGFTPSAHLLLDLGNVVGAL